jgi:5'-nucleotidase
VNRINNLLEKENKYLGDPMKLRIIHTNDLHSDFDNFTRTSTLIKEHKDENTIVLEAGDYADFKSIELQGTKGIAAVELLEAAGYDALTIGNNEMFNGVDTLGHMATNSKVPFISNNIFKKDKTDVCGVVPSIIIEKNGIRILITGSSPDMGDFNEGLGLYVKDYKKAIADEITRNKGNFDVCLLLNHVGTEADIELAEEIPGIDVIISSHDHKLYSEAKMVNETIMVSAGCYGEYIGVLDLEVYDTKIELLSSAVIATKDSDKDDQIVSILQMNKEKAIEVLKVPLYQINQPIWHDVIEENPMTNLLADGLRDLLKCDIGLINSGIVNAGVFDYVSEKKLIEICPSPLNPTYFEIQGKFIKQAIEQSLDVQVCLGDGRGPGYRGKYVGRLHVSGVNVIHDGRRILELYIAEKPIEDEKWYSVATSDYLQRGTGYESLSHNRNETYRAEEIREVIKIYANKPDFVERAYVNRFREQNALVSRHN